MSEKEKKDKRFSIIITSAIHAGLLLLFLFLVAWREPDPPIPEYGIELNLGFQEQGGGDTERETESQVEDTQEETPPQSEVEEEQVEEPDPVEETQEEVDPVEPDPVTEEVVEEVTEPVEETTPPVEETVEESVTTPEKAEVKVEEKKVEEVEEKQEEETTPPPLVEEKKEEEKPKPKPKPTVDSRALMGGQKNDSDSKDPASNNQGDDRALMGNQGDPEGKKNTKGSSPGGEDIGVSYSLDGWKWERPPADKDDSQIDGIIKFSIDVDDRGKVLSVSIIPGTTISDNTIVEFYKKQVLELRFLQIDPTKAPAAISKGEVTFVIKTN